MQHQPWEGPGYISWPLKGMNPFIHTLIPLMFIENLQCIRHCAGVRDTELSKREQNQVLVFMGFMISCSAGARRGRQQSREQTDKIIRGNDKDYKGN